MLPKYRHLNNGKMVSDRQSHKPDVKIAYGNGEYSTRVSDGDGTRRHNHIETVIPAIGRL